MQRRYLEGLILVVWCVVLLVGAKFVSRVFVPLPDAPRWRGFHVADSLAAYRLAPNLDGKIYFFGNVHIRTNRLGLRDREYGPRIPGVKRVLMLGDSQTLGLVEERNTLPRRLEHELERRDENWEVINAGVLGYGPEQELIRLRWLLPIYHPDLVVLTIFANDVYDSRYRPNERWYVGDDGYLHSRTEPSVTPAEPHTALRRALNWTLWHVNLANLAWKAAGRAKAAISGEATPRPAKDPDYARLQARDWDAQEKHDWARAESLIVEIAATARAGGAEILFVDGGSRAAVSWKMWPATVDTSRYDLDQETRLLSAAAARARAPCVHVLDAFRASRSPEALYFPNDDHWTPRANALVASMLAPVVRIAVRGTGPDPHLSTR